MQNIGNSRKLHVLTDTSLGKRIEKLVRTVNAEVLNYAVFRSDDKLHIVAFLCIIHDLRCASRKIRQSRDLGYTLGMNEQQRIWMLGSCLFNISLCDARMSGTAAADKLEGLFG